MALGTFHAFAFVALALPLTPIDLADVDEFPVPLLLLLVWASTLLATRRWLAGLRGDVAPAHAIGTGALWGAANGVGALVVALLATAALSGSVTGLLVYLAIAAPLLGLVGAAAGALLAAFDVGVFAIARRLAPRRVEF